MTHQNVIVLEVPKTKIFNKIINMIIQDEVTMCMIPKQPSKQGS